MLEMSTSGRIFHFAGLPFSGALLVVLLLKGWLQRSFAVEILRVLESSPAEGGFSAFMMARERSSEELGIRRARICWKIPRNIRVCRSKLGRFKIILKDLGIAEALSMSAADRVVLLILMAFVATSVMRSETAVKVAGLPGPVHRDEAGHGAVPELPGKAVSNPSAKTPASSVIEPTVVTVMERPMEEASASIGQTLAPPTPVALARELQKELKRVGCYAGKPNGVWSASTRRAMKAFSDRVNAKLPIDKPDSILLALVQSQPNKVCGEPCASGHELNQTQPCTWNGLLAGSSRTKFSAAPGQQATSEWTVKTAVPGTAKVPQGWLEPASPSSKFVGPPMQKRAPPRVARHWRAHPKHERAWVANFFRQRDRFSVY